MYSVYLPIYRKLITQRYTLIHSTFLSQTASVCNINATVSPCSFIAVVITDFFAIFKRILPVMLFQPAVKLLFSHSIGTVQTAPVTITAVQVSSRTFKVFPELHELFVLEKADDIAAVLHAVAEIFRRSAADSESEIIAHQPAQSLDKLCRLFDR